MFNGISFLQGGLSIPGFQSYRSDHDRPGDMGSSISRLGKGILSSTKGVLQQVWPI